MLVPSATNPPEPSGSSPTAAPPGIPPPSQARDIPDHRRSLQINMDRSASQSPPLSSSFKGLKWSPSRSKRKEYKVPSSSTNGSPPPPNSYERGVSFDTFDNRDAPDFSLTLNYKHKCYRNTRRSRTFLCGADQNDYSDFALEWLIDELVEDGDEIVCLRAVDKDSVAEDGDYRQAAQKLFEQVIQKNSQDEKAISLVVELAVGKVQRIIQRMIRLYEPAVLIVGTRGRNFSGMQGLLPRSISKYCLQHSPIPVIVVRPTLKREKKKQKRLADPSRRGYNHILEMSERRGMRILDHSSSTDSNVSKLPDERAAVADALGLPRSYAMSRTSLALFDQGSISHDESDVLSPSSNSLDAVVMKSPISGSSDASDNDSSLRLGSEDMTPPEDAKMYDSNSSTPRATATPPLLEADTGANTGSKASTRPEEEPDVKSDMLKLRVTIPVIVTEDISGGKNEE